mgnify:CR=1 FL=1
MFIVNTLKFPVANLVFGISWPLLPADKEAFSVYNIGGLCVEMTGVILFQYLSVSGKILRTETPRACLT